MISKKRPMLKSNNSKKTLTRTQSLAMKKMKTNLIFKKKWIIKIKQTKKEKFN